MLTDRIDIVNKRYDEIYKKNSNPEIIAYQKKYGTKLFQECMATGMGMFGKR